MGTEPGAMNELQTGQQLELMNFNSYPGRELELFSHALNWKSYIGEHLRSFIRGDVAEVGAGIGSTTLFLHNPMVRSWLCIEPDRNLSAAIAASIEGGRLPSNCSLSVGRLSDVPKEARFDAIVYIDVLEHIENDGAELEHAFSRLAPLGHLVVLVPAFQSLYCPFDRDIGHFRRYSRKQLIRVGPQGSRIVKAHYLDSIGCCLSMANKLFLRSNLPTPNQIAFWDRRVVPLSRFADKALSRFLGRSVVAIWQFSPTA